MSKAFITLVVVAIGFFVFQLLWPTTMNLPKIGAIDDWPLTEVNGNETSILNKPKIIAFFYTNCPDICPTNDGLKRCAAVIERQRHIRKSIRNSSGDIRSAPRYARENQPI